MKSGNILALTPNHEVYIERSWVPAGELARRVLEVCSWDFRSVHDLEPRQSFVCPEAWTEEFYFFKTLKDSEGAFASKFIGSGLSGTDSSPSISCFTFQRKSREQASCESYRFRPLKQLGGESGVGNSERECLSLERSEPSIIWGQKGSKKQQDHFDGRSSTGYSAEVQEEDCDKRDSWYGVRSEPSDNQGYNFAQELDPHLIEEIRFEIQQGYVYDLHVADNHNYVVTQDDLIVHNSGKSFLGCSLICGDALLYPGTNYFIARQTLADLRKHTRESIAEVLNGWNIPLDYYKYNGMDNFFEFKNGSKIYFFDCKPKPSDPLYHRFGSIQMTRGWLEESGEIDEEAKRSLAGVVGRWKNKEYNINGKILQTCNPSKNYLYREYYKPFKNGTLGLIANNTRRFIQALPSDNKMLHPDYIPGLHNKYNENQKQRLLYGNWEYDDDPSVLIDYSKMNGIFTNSNVLPGTKCVTADIARLGGDRIVVIGWDGYRGLVRSWKKQKLDYSTKLIEEIRLKVGCSKSMVLVDADGVGSGVQDFGGFVGFRNNSRPLPDPQKRRDANGKVVSENFDMLKSQCGFRMAELINSGGLYLECEDEDDQELIIKELEQVKQKNMETEGKRGLIPKEDMIKALGHSPDFWDAILMRKYFDLRTARMKITHRTGNDVRPEGEYGLRRRHQWNP